MFLYIEIGSIIVSNKIIGKKLKYANTIIILINSKRKSTSNINNEVDLVLSLICGLDICVAEDMVYLCYSV